MSAEADYLRKKNAKRDFRSIRPASSEINWKVRLQTLNPDAERRPEHHSDGGKHHRRAETHGSFA